MVKAHSDSEKGNPLPPHRLLFPINSKGSFICTIPQTGYTSRGALAGTRNNERSCQKNMVEDMLITCKISSIYVWISTVA